MAEEWTTPGGVSFSADDDHQITYVRAGANQVSYEPVSSGKGRLQIGDLILDLLSAGEIRGGNEPWSLAATGVELQQISSTWYRLLAAEKAIDLRSDQPICLAAIQEVEIGL